MDRTSIMLPPELKARAALQAKKMGISLGQFIRVALSKSLEADVGRETDNDSLFLDTAVFGGKSPDDLSSSHDEYLYGDTK